MHSLHLISHFTLPHSFHPNSPTFFLPHPFASPPLPLRSSTTRTSHVIAAVAEPRESARAEPLQPAEELTPAEPGGGPIEIPLSSSTSTLFANSDEPTPLQLSTSVLLTGAISVFLFRSLRRRARRAKELRVRSTGVKGTKDVKEEALESLRAMSTASLDPAKLPSPIQTFLGGIAAGVVAVILYKFTTTIEASLNRQAIPDNFSVRQITITVRTIVNGICYLATFVFGINSIGLLLYSGQLAINSFMEPDSEDSTSGRKNGDVLNTVASSNTVVDNMESVDGDS